MENFDDKIAPVMSTTDWIITILITSLPIINIIMLIVWAFSSTTNPNKSNWAKASLIWMLIGIGLMFLFWIVFGFAFLANMDEFNQ